MMTDKTDGKRRWRLTAIVITANAFAAFVFYVFGMPDAESDISELQRRAYLAETTLIVGCAIANIAAIILIKRYRNPAMLLSVAANGLLLWRVVAWWKSDFAASGELAPIVLSIGVIILMLISGYSTVTIDRNDWASRM
jgi:hypothetical protein